MKRILCPSLLMRAQHIKLILSLLFLTGVCSFVYAQPVSVTTDKKNYMPGDTVIITGTGWNPSDNVQLTLTHINPLPEPNHSHDPWFVIPDASGNFNYEWLVTDQEAGTSLELSALGNPSGDNAVTNFMVPSITNVTVSGSSFCDGQPVTVSYTISPEGSFDDINVFTAQLSDASGEFSLPVNIGTSPFSINSGNISAIIPPGTIPDTLYRIRVISVSPVITSDPDTTDITVTAAPEAPSSVTAIPASICSGESVNLNGTAFGNVINWYTTAAGGTSIGTSASGEDFLVTPSESTEYYAEAINTESCSSLSRTLVTVTVNPIPTITSTTPGSVCGSGTVNLSAASSAGIVNWYSEPIMGEILYTGTNFTTPVISASTAYYVDATANGCTTASRTTILATVNINPAAPAVGTITQPSCSVSTGSVVLNGLPVTGTWTIDPGAITGTGTSTTVTGLVVNTYNFTVTDASGCTSPASTDVIISAQPSTPTAPNVGTITQPTCTVSTGSVVLGGLPSSGTWTINPGAITGTGISTTITGLSPSTYNFTVTNAAGCISPVSADVVISAQPSTPAAPAVGTVTQPTCTVSTGSVILGGLPASGTWTINPGAITGTGTSTTITGLTADTYNFTVTNGSGCSSPASENVVINSQPSTPSAPTVGTITQPTCSIATGSVVLRGLPSTGTWTINPGAITGTGQRTTITGLASNTYNFTVTNAAGCTSSASAGVVINAQPVTPAAPTVGTIVHPTCSIATGSAVLNGLPATGTWTINPGAITGTGTSTTITGLAADTYNFTVTNGSGCISPASADVVINSQPSTPSAPTVGTITQPTCSIATGSVVLRGLPATGTWTINPGARSGTGTSTTITGLSPNTYNFTVTNAAGCTSATSANVVINAQPATPAAPAVGPITQPTCSVATGSAVLNGLPASGTWTINPGARTGTGTSTTITGLATNTYNFTVTNAAGCTSAASANVVINAQPVTPAAPTVGTIVQPTCTVATGSAVLNGLPATGTWTINPGARTGTGTSTTITGLSPNTYNYTVTNAAGCTSSASANVVINAQPATPAAPSVGTIVQPTCSVATGSAVLNGLPASGTWTINPGARTGTGTSTTITGLATNTYNFTVTNAAGCTSSASVNVVINTQPVTPASPTVGTLVQPTCTVATGSAVLNGLPASGTWTINPGARTGTGTSTTITGLATNTYNFTVTNAAGCTSAASANVVINAQPVTPAAPTFGTITQPGCTVATGSVVLRGLPSTGTWTINPGARTGTGTSTTITGLATNTYNFTVTNEAGCTSAASANAVINPQPPTPPAPIIGGITQPSCATSTGSVALSGLPAAGTWTLNCLPINMAVTGTGITYTATTIPTGTFTYTVTNSSGCISPPSRSFMINEQPPTPTAPSAGAVSPPTCILATGSVVFNGLPSTGTWTITRYPGTIITRGTGSSTTVSGIPPGTFNFTVMNQYECVSLPSSNVVIPSRPPIPSAPVVGTITQPTFTVRSGKVELSGLPPTGTWVLARLPDPDQVIIEGSGPNYTVTGLAGGLYTFTVRNSYGCTSEESAEVIISTPGKPDLIITDPAPVCAPATVDLTSPGITIGSTTGLTYTYWTDPEASIGYDNPASAAEGTYYIKGTTVSGFFSIKPVTATIVQMPIPNAGPDQVLALQFSTTLAAELAEGETGKWIIDSGNGLFTDIYDPTTYINDLSYGTNTLSWIVTNNVCPADTDRVLIIVGDIKIPTLITPNGDTKNEYLIILGLESLGESELIVFDRSGSRVFKNSVYDNKWNGVDHNENPLPSDTYFYILKAGNGRSYNGYVVIRR